MFSPASAFAALAIYMLFLVALAAWAERRGPLASALADSPLVYVLSLGVFCTSWTFYGSVGVASRSGFLYVAVYLGPTLVWLLGWTLIRRLARLQAAHRVSNLGDLLAARYGRTPGLPALATVLLLLAINPYIALQLKAILATFHLVVDKTLARQWPGAEHAAEFLVVGFITTVTILFGLRRMDPSQRQRGMVMVVAAESVVKLVAFLAAGIFVTYGLYDGLEDIFSRLAARVPPPGPETTPQWYVSFLTWLILSMGAILFLPRQFHVTLVELSRISHLRAAMWGLPLYLLAIAFFVYPIAAAGLLHGYPAAQADTLVLTLPLNHGNPWLALLVFIGGFSSAVAMIMICSMTLSVMVANNLVMPLAEKRVALRGLRRHGLGIRRTAVVCIILAGYLFERTVGESHFLAAMGLVSFAGALQFAPPVLGGMFWRQASRTGALWGLTGGFIVWIYTLFLPAMAKSGWLPPSFLEAGPLGLSLLKPEALFGLSGLDALTHGVLWSLLANTGLFVLGSCWRQADEEEHLAMAAFRESSLGIHSRPLGSRNQSQAVDLEIKLVRLKALLGQYLAKEQFQAIIDESLAGQQLLGRDRITPLELLHWLSAVETRLAGAIGTAAAHTALRQGGLISPQETEQIARMYGEILADLNLSPEELRQRVDYYQERHEIINRHANELAEKVRELEQEIAARAQAENALRESEGRFRTMADTAPVKIWMADDKGDRYYFNQAWLTFTGRPLSRELRQGWLDGIAPEDRCRWQKEFAAALAGRRTYRIEYRLRRHDGEFRWLAERGAPRLSAAGEILGFIGSCIDISDMKAAAEALRRSRDELEALVAERTAELTRANAALQEEVEQRCRIEDSLLASNAELKRINERLAEAQSQLLQSEKMASIGQLAAGVAHEINNPIGFVSSNLMTLRTYIDDLLRLIAAYEKLEGDPTDPKLAEAVHQLREAADLDYLREDIPSLLHETLEGVQRVRQIVRDLKDFSHVDEAEWQEADLHAGLDSTLNVVWNELKYKAQVVKDYGNLPRIPCIPSQLNQVFMNLLVNAAQAIPDRGTITIRTGCEQDWVWVEVEDTGSGIPPENVNRLFEPFFTTKPVGKGTGLGLSVSYGIVRNHGGRIEVRSEVGKGTAVRVWLPRVQGTADTATGGSDGCLCLE